MVDPHDGRLDALFDVARAILSAMSFPLSPRVLCLSALGLLVARAALADAIVITKAMTASTIAEIYVERDLIRLELEGLDVIQEQRL